MILLVLDKGLGSSGSSRGSGRRSKLLSDGNLRLCGVLAHEGVNRREVGRTGRSVCHTGFDEARFLWNMANGGGRCYIAVIEAAIDMVWLFLCGLGSGLGLGFWIGLALARLVSRKYLCFYSATSTSTSSTAVRFSGRT